VPVATNKPINFIVIGSTDDRQVSSWLLLARQMGHSAVYLDIKDAGNKWSLEVDGEPRIVFGRQSLELASPRNRWYLRGPLIAPPSVIQLIEIIHSLLILFASPEWRYLPRGNQEGHFSSKLFQLTHAQIRVPKTCVRSRLDGARTLRSSTVIKSISQIRSTVVTLEDPRLGTADGLHLEQERILDARLFKVHGYVRSGTILSSLAVECLSKCIDYREDDNVQYRLGSMTQDIKEVLLFCASVFGVALFDIDIFDTSKGLVLLEVNFSPAPAYFENIIDKSMIFSRDVLIDFLGSR
jgi:hypothetical protein